MDTDKRSTAISKLGLECQDRFLRMLTVLKESSHFPPEACSELVLLEDELGRFRTWANNIGAFGTGRGGLERRVRNAQYLRENIASLLQDLNNDRSTGRTRCF